ncbi:hypothetical protein BLNAU_2534 [Blattamonas nauphoetae]|uniref:Uncharacterized protein n=1 Tax=Blattamonas nauphoetae TaxID=2049346 RepID=A0ABQ9YG17_9EUKA|nr:hypothetical protein BLNAU_2534 [Blattamonas nauphoetae]
MDADFPAPQPRSGAPRRVILKDDTQTSEEEDQTTPRSQIKEECFQSHLNNQTANELVVIFESVDGTPPDNPHCDGSSNLLSIPFGKLQTNVQASQHSNTAGRNLDDSDGNDDAPNILADGDNRREQSEIRN